MKSKKLIFSLGMLFICLNFAYASVPSNEECHVIHDSYSSDVNIIIGLLNSINTTLPDNAAVTQLKSDITNGLNNIQQQPYYTVTKAVYDSLKKDIRAINDPTQIAQILPFMDQFHDQKKSMDDRVDEWKSTKYHSTSCRDKHGCMLGQGGTYCAVNVSN